MKQSRLRSKVVLASLAAQIISLGQLTGLWAKLGIDVGTLGDIVALILQIGVVIGVLNDPTSKNQF